MHIHKSWSCIIVVVARPSVSVYVQQITFRTNQNSGSGFKPSLVGLFSHSITNCATNLGFKTTQPAVTSLLGIYILHFVCLCTTIILWQQTVSCKWKIGNFWTNNGLPFYPWCNKITVYMDWKSTGKSQGTLAKVWGDEHQVFRDRPLYTARLNRLITHQLFARGGPYIICCIINGCAYFDNVCYMSEHVRWCWWFTILTQTQSRETLDNIIENAVRRAADIAVIFKVDSLEKMCEQPLHITLL